MKKLGKAGILLTAFVTAPLFAKASNAEFVSVVTDRSDLQYTEGDQAHISVTKRISPTDPNFALTFESYFPDGGHPITMAKIGDIYSFITPKLQAGQSHFIVNAYLQFLAKPPLRDGARSLVESKDVVLNVSHDTTAPILSISSPTDNQVIQGMSLHVAGYANEALSQVTVHFDNDAPVPATLSGNLAGFSADLTPSHRGSTVLHIDAKDLAGNQTSKQISVSFDYNRAPVANLTLTSLNPTTAPAMALFDASSSTDPDGDAIQYSYDFGDGTPIQSGISTVTHQYETAGSYTAQITVTDAGGLASSKSVSVAVAAVVLPPNPQDIAPPIATEPNSPPPTMVDKVGFIYSGPNPVQTGVNQNAMDPELVSVFRGHISDDSNNSLSGVKVTIAGESVFGQTLTRDDGNFDIAVNAGGDVTIQMEKTGYTPVQRTVSTDGQNYYAVPDVVMASLDQKVTTVSLSKPEAQVVQASTVTDNDGERTASLILPSQTTAQIQMPDGSLKAVDNLSIRATEVTVGENGPKKMPGQLPPKTAYTYAVDLTSDEAIAMGGKGVKFNQPIPFYVDNFLGFPVGTAVPVGYFNPDTHVWEPQKDGIVIKITDIQNGKAVVSVSPGVNATADDLEYFKITDEELTKLAATYPVGKELWRAQTTHFSTIDLNFMGDSQPDPQTPGSLGDVNPDCGCKIASGSIIDINRRALAEKIDLVGVPFPLYYSSISVPGRKAQNTITTSLYTTTPRADLSSIDFDVSIAGRTFHQSYTDLNTPALLGSLNWDGKDAYGRKINDINVGATVSVKYHYKGDYYYAPFDRTKDQSFDTYQLGKLEYSASRKEMVFSKQANTTLTRSMTSGTIAAQKNLGLWSIPIYHHLDVQSGVVVLGTGDAISKEQRPSYIRTVLGKGSAGFSGDGGLAVNAKFKSIDSYAFQSDGTILVIDGGNNRIRRIGRDGIINTIAGNGTKGYNGDEIPAVDAEIFTPSGITQDRQGNIYFADTGNNRIRKITSDGIIHTIAGTGTLGFSGDGLDAKLAQLNKPRSLQIPGDGSIYFSDTGNNVIRRIRASGNIETIGGTGVAGYSGDGGQFIDAQLSNPRISYISPDGIMYITDSGNNVIREVSRGGVISTIAGTGTAGFSGDEGPAISAELNGPTNVSVRNDGSILVADKGNNRIRLISNEGTISTIIGTGIAANTPDGNMGTDTNVNAANIVNGRHDDSIYYVDGGNLRVKQYLSNFVQLDTQTNEYQVVSSDGSEIYVFDVNGTHIKTLSSLTGAIKFRFEHNSSGNLSGIFDTYENKTVFTWSGDKISAIISPYGQTTTLSYDPLGNLVGVSSPMGLSHNMSYYGEEGLLRTFQKPNGNYSFFVYENDTGYLVSDVDALGNVQNTLGSLSGSGVNYSSAEQIKQNLVYKVTRNGSRANDNYPDYSEIETFSNGHTQHTFEKTTGYKESTKYSADVRFPGDVTYPSTNYIAEVGTTDLSSYRQRTYLTLNGLFDYVRMDEVNDTTGAEYTETFSTATRTHAYQSGMGRTKSIVLDENENIFQTQTGSFYPINYSYDSRGNLIQIQQDNRITTYSYNAQGLLNQTTDPLGRTSSETYDTDGRLSTRTTTDGRVHQFFYDDNSNLIGITPFGRALHQLFYSAIDLFTKYTPANDSGNSISLTYNKDKKLTKSIRADGRSITNSYSPLTGRLVSKLTNEGERTFDYPYGKLATITAPSCVETISSSGEIVTALQDVGAYNYTYQNFFEEHGHRLNGIAISGVSLPISYDQDGLLSGVGSLQISRDTTSTVITAVNHNNTSQIIGYNGFGEMISSTYSYSGANLYSEQYTRDQLGRIIGKSVQTSAGTNAFSYVYDLAGRLKQVLTNGIVSSEYTYDSQGNRLSVVRSGNSISGTYDGQDKIQTYGNLQYSLSLDGEITSILDNSNGNTMTFGYTSYGQLSNAKLWDGRHVSYTMDAHERRYSKSIDGTVVANFGYDDHGRLVIDADASGNTRNIYVYATQGHSPDYIIHSGQEYTLIKDQLGSVVMVVNASTGAIAQQIAYDEYGRVLSDTNPGFQFIGFAGGIYDADTKLVKFGVREYDAETGRWMSKDPTLFAGGMNFYGYSFNDPVNFIDPSGLDPGDRFTSVDAAIADAFKYILRTRGDSNTREYGGQITRTKDGGYTYCSVTGGDAHGVDLGYNYFGFGSGVADFHTHLPNSNHDFGNSFQDETHAMLTRIPSYVLSPTRDSIDVYTPPTPFTNGSNRTLNFGN